MLHGVGVLTGLLLAFSAAGAPAFPGVLGRLSAYGRGGARLVAAGLRGGEGLAAAVETLGPLWIKVGQSLVSRPDLIGPQTARLLRPLLERVTPAFDGAEVCAVLKAAGFDRHVNLSTVTVAPVAAASLGQVHRAELLDGTPVALKVLRPGLAEIIATDLFLLRLAASAIQPLLKTNVLAAVDEIGVRLLEETNLDNEAKNLALFRSLYDFESGGTHSRSMPRPGVGTPALYANLCNDRIVTMGWIDGTSLVEHDTMPKKQLLEITTLGLRCSLSQLLDTGVLHADPHFGNLVIEQETGRLVYLDFGLLARVPKRVRLALLCAVVHLVERDYSALAGEFEDLLLLSAEELRDNREALEAALEKAVADIFVFGVNEGEEEKAADVLQRLPRLKFDQIVATLLRLASQFNLLSPPYFANNVRAISSLDGMALSADPKFNLFRVVYPFMVSRLFAELDEPKIAALFRKLVLCPKSGLVRWVKVKLLLREACAPGSGCTPLSLLRGLLATRGGRSFLRQTSASYIAQARARLARMLLRSGWRVRSGTQRPRTA